MDLTLELINGIKIGIEHLNVEDMDDEVKWMIMIDLVIIRIGIIRFHDFE